MEKIVPQFEDHITKGTNREKEELEVLWTGNDHEDFGIVRVPPHKLSRVKRQVPHRFVIPNLQDFIDGMRFMSSNQASSSMYLSAIVPNFRLDQYHNLDEIYDFINEVSRRSSGVTVFDIGTTHEGRKLKGVEIVGNPDDPTLVWIDAGTHAREWITPAVALFIIENAIISRFQFNLVIVPVLNPDGYSYTWTHDRLWRKNRRPPTKEGAGESCFGVDLNRNYDVKFGGQGSSPNECSHLFQGPEALSEPETAAVANLLWSIRRQVKMFISLHSFNQLWASPFAYTKSVTPHHGIHMDVLKTIQTAVHDAEGVMYSIGPLSTSLYVGSGFALDWAYSNANIVHSYLAELRDKGYYGFLLPVEQIIPTASETWAGIRAGIKKVYSMR
jgi:carboxypeptidase A2